MRWETRGVGYDLRAGVIIRQPTINVNKVWRLSEKFFAFHKPTAAVQFTFDTSHYIPLE